MQIQPRDNQIEDEFSDANSHLSQNSDNLENDYGSGDDSEDSQTRWDRFRASLDDPMYKR